MIVDIFGYKVRIEYIVGFILAYMLLSSITISSCSKVNSFKEGMQMLGSELDYKMGTGVNNSWENMKQTEGPSISFREHNHDAYQSKFVDPSESLNFFNDTEFSYDCCGSSYSGNGGLLGGGGSSSGGCACLNKKQVDYINTRGGNRTLNSDI
jgi:hypothetical protein